MSARDPGHGANGESASFQGYALPTRTASASSRYDARLWSRATGPWVVGLALLTMPGLAFAQDPEPSGGQYQVLYSITDEDGDLGRQMSEQDLKNFVNQARCECGQEIVARITLAGSAASQTQTEAYVGQACDTGQQGIGTQFRPCAQLVAGFPATFTTGPSFRFNPVWLGWGVDTGSSQVISSATPVGGCSERTGSGGIWMCEGATTCQSGQFFMSGNSNINSMEVSSVTFDFVPPLSVPRDFEIDTGDGSVVLSWSIDAAGDIAGYRVLCADENGQPLPGRGVSAPSATEIPNGTIYYTASNLCPNGPFSDLPDFPDGGDGDGDGGDSTGGDDSGGSEAGESGGGMEGDLEGGDDGGMSPADSPMGSLDYDYVCSKHLPFNTNEVRIGGLENGRSYQFMVVTYDAAGNPALPDAILVATPVETRDLWEQCEAQGDVCGEAGFCAVQRPRGSAATWLAAGVTALLLGLGALGVRRRRRVMDPIA